MGKKSFFSSSFFEVILFFLAIIFSMLSIMWLEATYKRKNQEKEAVVQKEKTYALSLTPTRSPFVTLTPHTKTTSILLRVSEDKFTPDTIRVAKNTVVKITLQNESGYHNFIQNDYGIASKKLTQGESETFAFVATQSGTFIFYPDDGYYGKDPLFSGKLIVE